MLAPPFRLDLEKVGKGLTNKVKEDYDENIGYGKWKPKTDNAFGPFNVSTTVATFSGNDYKWSTKNNNSNKVYIGFSTGALRGIIQRRHRRDWSYIVGCLRYKGVTSSANKASPKLSKTLLTNTRTKALTYWN